MSRFSWIEDHFLNAAAYLALGLLPPLEATLFVGRLAQAFPKLDSAAEALDVARRLGGFGTCLTRAMSIACRCRGAVVVVGVAAPTGHRPLGASYRRFGLDAHAWVELRGTPLCKEDPHWKEIGRLNAPSVPANVHFPTEHSSLAQDLLELAWVSASWRSKNASNWRNQKNDIGWLGDRAARGNCDPKIESLTGD